MARQNPLLVFAGVQDEFNQTNNPQEKMLLRVFSLFFVLSIITAFACFYVPISINYGTWKGVFFGTLWALIIWNLDRSLFREGSNIALAVVRFFLVILFSGITSFFMVIGLGDKTIKSEIKEQTEYDNTERMEYIKDIEEEYDSQINELRRQQVTHAVNREGNETVQDVLDQQIQSLEKEKYRKVGEARNIQSTKEPDNSFFNKCVTYLDMLETEGYGLKIWYPFFAVEMSPLIIFFCHFMFFGYGKNND